MEMYWKPKAWIAILLGFFMSPFAFLYVNKSAYFWLYLILLAIAGSIDSYLNIYTGLVFYLLCPVHAYLLSKKQIQANERKWFSRWWAISGIVASIIIPIFLVRSFIFEPFRIPAQSMSPTINVGDLIVVKKLGFGSYGAYGVSLWNPGVSDDEMMKIGSIYAFFKPGSNIPYVKRLIAKAGDTVEIKSGLVFVNNKPLELTPIENAHSEGLYNERVENSSYYIFNKMNEDNRNFGKVTVPPNGYFFLGDNRGNSLDSRYYGAIDNQRIIGEVIYIFH